MSPPQDLVWVFILHWSSKLAHCRVYTALPGVMRYISSG